MKASIIWTLRYDSSVTAFLRSIRGIPTAHRLHETIKALQHKTDPTEECRSMSDRPGRYEVEIDGYWIGLRVLKDERVIRVLYITTT